MPRAPLRVARALRRHHQQRRVHRHARGGRQVRHRRRPQALRTRREDGSRRLLRRETRVDRALRPGRGHPAPRSPQGARESRWRDRHRRAQRAKRRGERARSRLQGGLAALLSPEPHTSTRRSDGRPRVKRPLGGRRAREPPELQARARHSVVVRRLVRLAHSPQQAQSGKRALTDAALAPALAAEHEVATSRDREHVEAPAAFPPRR